MAPTANRPSRWRALSARAPNSGGRRRPGGRIQPVAGMLAALLAAGALAGTTACGAGSAPPELAELAPPTAGERPDRAGDPGRAQPSQRPEGPAAPPGSSSGAGLVGPLVALASPDPALVALGEDPAAAARAAAERLRELRRGRIMLTLAVVLPGEDLPPSGRLESWFDYDDPSASQDPASQVDLVARAEGLRAEGVETLAGGVQALRLAGALAPGVAAAALDLEVSEVPAWVPVHLWIDSEGRPVRLHMDMSPVLQVEVPGGRSEALFDFYDLGLPP